MSYVRLLALPCIVTLASCASDSGSGSGSIGQLRHANADLTDLKVEGGLDKAMQSYQRFLEQTPEAAMTPEALRRLADLKVQKEYGTLEGVSRNNVRLAQAAPQSGQAQTATAPLPAPVRQAKPGAPAPAKLDTPPPAGKKKARGKGANATAAESNQAFEARASKTDPLKSAAPLQAIATPDGTTAELQGGAAEAIQLYQKLLAKYPNYDRNDQVLYQLSRAYDEVGMVDEAMRVMSRIAKEYPKSRYFDEVQFRIGEYYFTRKKFLDAEEAYKSIAAIGPASSYYELALYKLGWTLYKQEMYEESLHPFMALLDHKTKTGYDFENPVDALAHKRIEDTYHVISLAFSNLGGSDAVMAYFGKYGKRSYEVNVYGNLGEYYLDKLRYSDAAVTYKAFVKQNPYHKISPHYDTRVIEIYKKGGFPKLVIDANKEFVVNYGLKSPYWTHFDIKAFPQVVGYVKTSLVELANHYHSLYQAKGFEKEQPENFREAMHWYGEFLTSFPKEPESPNINHQLAELLLENKSYAQAAIEFERTAYDYPPHDKAAEAGYAAVYAHRKHLGEAGSADKPKVTQDVIRSSLKFAETFRQHEKAALVMGAAVDDIYETKNYGQAVTSSRRLIELFPTADASIRRSAWLIMAHSSFELAAFKDAELAYLQVLPLTAENDKTRPDLVEALAASIYKQGEQAGKQGDHKTAAEHFLRVAQAAPTSKIRPTADYDGATALVQLKDWDRAISVLSAFRSGYPAHALQPEVTKKMAFVYRESGKLALAAAEYERMETETKDIEMRSAALQMAGDLYVEAKETDKAVVVYRRYISYFPKPLDLALENRFKIANILKARNEITAYFAELKGIVDADARGGNERTDRTRYLGATSLLAINEPVYEQYTQIKLVKPFEQNLARKKTALKQVKDAFEGILRYEIGETTAAATYYLAEMYYNFNRSLVESERPDDLSGDEKEQYELALEDQAYPFEEKAIQVHKKNTELISLGVYNHWVENSFAKLAKLVPARYAKFEESSGFVSSFNRAVAFDRLTAPKVPASVPAAAPPVAQPVDSEQAESVPAAAQPAESESPPEAAAAAAPVADEPATVAAAVPAAPAPRTPAPQKKKATTRR